MRLVVALSCSLASLLWWRGSARAQDLMLEAKAAAERGRMDTAYTLLQRAVEAEPQRADAHFWLGLVAGTRASEHRSLGSFFMARRAKRELQRAVALDPGNPVYLEGLGRYLARAPGIVGGDRDSARSLARNLLQLDPMRGTSLLVELLWRSGRPGDRAEADSLIEAFARNPSGGREGQIRLAQFFSRSGKVERALPIAEQLVAADSADGVGRSLLGGALVTLGREPETAARHLRWAIEHPPPVTTDGRHFWPPALWLSLGRAYAQLGEPDSARAAWQEALRIEPGFRRAKAALDSLSRR